MKISTYVGTLVGAVFMFVPMANAQDYIAVSVEAENFSQKNSLWRVFSNSSTPNVQPDPDGSHHSSASGRSYVELLPDTRVTHSDQLSTGRNFWDQAGTGPSLSYSVNIPEAGRYLVFAKAYSTGTEDNGIHVGLNPSNPASGHRMQWCGGKNRWTWSSAQRTNSNHCGVQRTIYLDIPNAGSNTIVFTAREDGFELDKFILLKENVAGLTCSPNDSDNITCNRAATGVIDNGGTETNTPVVVNEPPAPVPAPVPSPVVTEPVAAPVPVAENSPVSETLQACTSAESDQDGDGYGWENNRTCLVTAGQSTVNNSHPTCVSAASDSDGDGFGWENNQSCLVSGASAAGDVADVPVCELDTSDPDQDGWGWENSRSCIVR